MAVLLLCLSFDAPRVVRNSSFDRWFQYGTTCSAFLMTWKRVSLRAKARGDQRQARKVSMRIVLGIFFARLSTRGAPQGLISAEYATTLLH
jgi:hypothetical protein